MSKTIENYVINEEYDFINNMKPSYLELNMKDMMVIAVENNIIKMIHFLFKKACLYCQADLYLFKAFFDCNDLKTVDISLDYINMCDWHTDVEIFKLFFNANNLALDVYSQFYHFSKFTKPFEVFECFFDMHPSFSLLARNDNNETLFHFMCRYQHSLNIFQLCFEHDAEKCLNIQDYNGQIPLAYICKSHDDPKVIKLIMTNNPNEYINIQDNLSKTPIDYFNIFTPHCIIVFLVQSIRVNRKILRLFSWHFPRTYLIFRKLSLNYST